MTTPPSACRLPVQFAPAPLQADIATLGTEEWVAHFNTGYYAGEWSGVALRSPAGSRNQIYADNSHGDFGDTALLEHCPHLRAVVESFECPLRSVRLLRLTAGSEIREHRDYDLGYEDGEVRIHVPVTTHPGVAFYLDNRRITMREGECWYLDLNLPHRVHNPGPADRVHLVIDCQLNDWLRDLISRGTPGEGVESGFEAFRRLVLDTPHLQDQLVDILDHESFVLRAVELGCEQGHEFLSADVHAAIQAGRRDWMGRRFVQ